MASSSGVLKMSEENFEYICTCCAEGDLIKQALKYCVECQQYCCKDCLTCHERISSLKGHSFLDNASVKPKGQPPSQPAPPMYLCSKHVGNTLDRFCDYHDVVCCYLCREEDHKSCTNVVSVPDNKDQLFSKTDTDNAKSDLSKTLVRMNQWQTHTDQLLQELLRSKVSAIKTAREFRLEMEKLLKKLEETTVKKIEDEYKKLKTQILEEKKLHENFASDLKNLQQLIIKASGNIAQLFVCTKLIEKRCTAIGNDASKRGRFDLAEVNFLPIKELKSSIQRMENLGKVSSILTRKYNTAIKLCDMDAKLQTESSMYNCMIFGACTDDDTIIFTDYNYYKLKRFNASPLAFIDDCVVPARPYGICQEVRKNVVVVACLNLVQFVSTSGQLSLLHSFKMKHKCYGIAYKNDKLYITDESKSLYMYDMTGNLLKTVTDDRGQSLFECSNHVTFYKDRLFVADSKKGLVCFNVKCDYIETISDPDIKPDGVCTDDYGNVVVVNYGL